MSVIGDYYHIIYTGEVIPLKYKALMAITTGLICASSPSSKLAF